MDQNERIRRYAVLVRSAAGGAPTAPNRGPDLVVQAINYTVRQRSGQSSVD